MTDKEKLSKAILETRLSINRQLYKDDIKPALEELFQFCQQYKQDKFIGEIIIQSASLIRLETANRQGIINWEQVNTQKNKIILHTLRLMDILKEEVVNIPYEVVKVPIELVNEIKVLEFPLTIKEMELDATEEEATEAAVAEEKTTMKELNSVIYEESILYETTNKNKTDIFKGLESLFDYNINTIRK